MINRKAKGIQGERELVHFFNENHWACHRIAGSGSSRYPSPDLIAGNGIRKLAIECKVTKDNKKYISPADIQQLQTFSTCFGAEPWIGIKFPNDPWYFLMLEDLENTGKFQAISIELARRNGLTAHELLELNQNI